MMRTRIAIAVTTGAVFIGGSALAAPAARAAPLGAAAPVAAVKPATVKPAAAVTAAAAPTAVKAAAKSKPIRLHSRCRKGRVLCVSKTDRKVYWVVNGRVKMVLDARFGGKRTPTREGTFRVYRKSRNHVSSIYHTRMPFALFFSGGQAIHYSPDFARKGYRGTSHGCVNTRQWTKMKNLFNTVKRGTKVVVYRRR